MNLLLAYEGLYYRPVWFKTKIVLYSSLIKFTSERWLAFRNLHIAEDTALTFVLRRWIFHPGWAFSIGFSVTLDEYEHTSLQLIERCSIVHEPT